MKTSIALVLLLASLQTQALSPVCEALFAAKPTSTQALALDWATDAGFQTLRREHIQMGQVKSVYDRELQTRLYYTATGLPDGKGNIPIVDPDARAVVVFFHGSGTAAGGGVNFTSSMNKLANIGISGMSFDLPFHADGPRRDQFYHREFLMKWIHEVLAPARESGKPVYLVGHSFGPEIILEYLYTYPHDVAGASLLSPVGFNQVLRDWEKRETGHMIFGGEEVADNTLGGLWADTVSKSFKWQKSGGAGDPTIENPDLRIEVLTGAWEEYAPGPTGGKHGLPTGPNTYSIGNALRPFVKRANIVTEPNVGHMIFNVRDANGRDIVSRTIFNMIGVDGKREGQMAQELTERRNGRPSWIELEAMMAQDRFFQAYLAATHQTGFAAGLVRKANNEQALKLMNAFRDAFKARQSKVPK